MQDYKTRKLQANAIYQSGLKRVDETPEPENQKFNRGQRVKIADDLGSAMSYFRSGVEATVRYTYAHAYGGDDAKSYSLSFDDGRSCAWYKEWQLTAI